MFAKFLKQLFGARNPDDLVRTRIETLRGELTVLGPALAAALS